MIKRKKSEGKLKKALVERRRRKPPKRGRKSRKKAKLARLDPFP